MWEIILAGFGMMLLIEGALYAGAPSMMRRFAAMLSALPDTAVRQSGLFSIALGFLIVYVIVRFWGV